MTSYKVQLLVVITNNPFLGSDLSRIFCLANSQKVFLLHACLLLRKIEYDQCTGRADCNVFLTSSDCSWLHCHSSNVNGSLSIDSHFSSVLQYISPFHNTCLWSYVVSIQSTASRTPSVRADHLSVNLSDLTEATLRLNTSFVLNLKRSFVA